MMSKNIESSMERHLSEEEGSDPIYQELFRDEKLTWIVNSLESTELINRVELVIRTVIDRLLQKRHSKALSSNAGNSKTLPPIQYEYSFDDKKNIATQVSDILDGSKSLYEEDSDPHLSQNLRGAEQLPGVWSIIVASEVGMRLQMPQIEAFVVKFKLLYIVGLCLKFHMFEPKTHPSL
jgi:hypothetical protein